MVSLLENHPLETDRPLKNWASLPQIRQLNLCNKTQWQHPQKILLVTCKHGLISTAGRTIICYTFSNKEITDCVYIFIAPSLAMMQTRSRCFSSLRVRIIGSVMLKFGCSSLKNKNQSHVMNITMTSEYWMVFHSEKDVINYYLHQKTGNSD